MSTGINASYDDIIAKGTPIWENIYPVKTTVGSTYSDEYLKNAWMPTTGNKKKDEQMLKEHIDVYLTIDAIVERYRVGTVVIFKDNKHAKEIYEIVCAYLQVWSNVIQNSYNSVDAPIDDLLLLDRFAGDLFAQSQIFNGLQTTLSLGGIGDILKQFIFGGNANKLEDTVIAHTHTSFGQALTKASLDRTKAAAATQETTGSSRWR